jgi:hypothetical protein
MAINFIPNDPLAGTAAPALRAQTKHSNRPAGRATFKVSNASREGTLEPGAAGFLFWQCREAAFAALDAWEAATGKFSKWQGNRSRLDLLHDAGVDLNAFYDRSSFSFFHQQIQDDTVFSGVSTDVVAHEVGHGLLDAIRPDLWDSPFLETGAFHEAFGDCMAILTALNDRATREALLASTTTLSQRNFVESTAEHLSDAIRRLAPNHSAAEPRHAFNTFQFAIPETLPGNGGPGSLINEVHSFGMLFSGCFYDLIAALFAGQVTRTEAELLASAKTAGALLAAAAKTALITPRFFQSVGRAMVLADADINGGANRDRIRNAFEGHAIMLGANALLAPAAALAGPEPTGRRTLTLSAGTRKDLMARLGTKPGTKFSVESVELGGQRFARAVHKQKVALGSLDNRLKGVTIEAAVPVMVGGSRGRAAVMGVLPEPVSTEREVQAFVESLLEHGQIEFAAPRSAGARSVGARSAVAGRRDPLSRETHRVRSAGATKVLERVRFHCGPGCRHAR